METYNKAKDLEAFLAGELKEGDLWEFRKKLENDKDLQKQVQLHQEVYEAISDTKKWSIVSTISSIRKQNSKQRRITLYSWKTEI